MNTSPNTEILLSPEGNRNASIILYGPLGTLFIQCLDEYGFQRELVISIKEDESATLHAYMHPGRRELKDITEKEAVALIERFKKLVPDSADLLFNSDTPRNRGFVRFQEGIFRGYTVKQLLEIL